MIQFLWFLLLCEEEPFLKEKKLCMPCVYVYQIDIISLLITEKKYMLYFWTENVSPRSVIMYTFYYTLKYRIHVVTTPLFLIDTIC